MATDDSRYIGLTKSSLVFIKIFGFDDSSHKMSVRKGIDCHFEKSFASKAIL